MKEVDVQQLTAKFLLPLHLIMQKGCLFKEVSDLAALLILLSGVEDTDL